jgi:MFS family permease
MSTTSVTIARAAIPVEVRRNTGLLAGAQCISWIGTQTLATLGSIIAFRLTADQRWAGIPVTLSILATALAAPYAGRLMDRYGRKPILLAGQAGDGLGSLIAGVSVLSGSFGGFLFGLTIRGIGLGATTLSRSAAADMYPPAHRAQGMSVVVTGGAAGAILGPLLLQGLTTWTKNTNADPQAVPWLGLALLSLVGLAALAAVRPDPRTIGANLALYYPGETTQAPSDALPPRPVAQILGQYPAIVALAATSLSQAGMVMLMVTASLAMTLHGHGEAVYGVMAGHFFGMLGLSLFIGRVADRLGRKPVIIAGALTFIAGAVTAPLFENPLYNGASLFLVGLGWSLCYVAGNAILADIARPLERARTLGTGDLLFGLAGAGGSLVGGLLLGGAGYLTVGAVGLALGLVPIALALRLREPEPGRYGG